MRTRRWRASAGHFRSGLAGGLAVLPEFQLAPLKPARAMTAFDRTAGACGDHGARSLAVWHGACLWCYAALPPPLIAQPGEPTGSTGGFVCSLSSLLSNAVACHHAPSMRGFGQRDDRRVQDSFRPLSLAPRTLEPKPVVAGGLRRKLFPVADRVGARSRCNSSDSNSLRRSLRTTSQEPWRTLALIDPS
jgi:hypothetical protein